MKPATWIGLAIIVGALAFGARAFVTNLTPYISFAQAREAKGQVQIVGKLDKTSVAYQENQKRLHFDILDDRGDRMSVAYSDVRPPNFEMATQITAIGSYDGTTFQANKLLVKCPSKYQGTETEKEYDGSTATGRTVPAPSPGGS